MNYFLKPFFILIFSLKFCSAQSFTIQDTSFTEGEILVTYDVRFELGKCIFDVDTLLFLDEMVAFLIKNQTLAIEVGCHVDERWSSIHSRSLTQSRAEEIVNYLILKGIDSNRLLPVGYDGSNPIIKNAKTEDEHQINRRTEFKVIRTDFKE